MRELDNFDTVGESMEQDVPVFRRRDDEEVRPWFTLFWCQTLRQLYVCIVRILIIIDVISLLNDLHRVDHLAMGVDEPWIANEGRNLILCLLTVVPVNPRDVVHLDSPLRVSCHESVIGLCYGDTCELFRSYRVHVTCVHLEDRRLLSR